MDAEVFLGALLGALFGFLGGLVIEWLVTWWGRRERRSRYRILVANDLIRNLSALAAMEESTRITKERGYSPAAEIVIDTPRVDLFRSVVSATDALLPLTRREQLHMVELSARLDRLLREYAAWPGTLGGEKGMLQVRFRDGSLMLQRDVSTAQLLQTIEDVMVVHISMLIQVLNNSTKRNLADPLLRSLWTALAPTRKGWLPSQKLNCICAVRMPSTDQLSESERRKPLVVWARNKQDYPAPVIELKGIIE